MARLLYFYTKTTLQPALLQLKCIGTLCVYASNCIVIHAVVYHDSLQKGCLLVFLSFILLVIIIDRVRHVNFYSVAITSVTPHTFKFITIVTKL